MIQPTATKCGSLVMNNSSDTTLALVLNSAGLLTFTPISIIVNNNSQLNDVYYLSDAELNVIGAKPRYPSSANKMYRSRITVETISWTNATPSVLDPSVTGVMLQGAQALDFTNSNTTTAYGSISLTNATLSRNSYTPAYREMI